MTFNQAEVVGVTSFSGGVSIGENTSDSDTAYTVPAGKYAICFIDRSQTSASSGSANTNVSNDDDTDPIVRGVQIALNESESITASVSTTAGGSASASISGVAIEFNKP